MVSIEEIQAAYYMVAATGVLVAAAYYVLNMRQTVENRKATLYNSIWNQSCNNPEFQKNFLRFQSLKWSNYDEYIKLCPINDVESENSMAVWSIALFFEGLSPIVKDGLVEIKYLANSILWYFLQAYWLRISIIADETRVRWDIPACWGGTEDLYKLILDYRERHGGVV